MTYTKHMGKSGWDVTGKRQPPTNHGHRYPQSPDLKVACQNGNMSIFTLPYLA